MPAQPRACLCRWDGYPLGCFEPAIYALVTMFGLLEGVVRSLQRDDVYGSVRLTDGTLARPGLGGNPEFRHD